ncbi:hypothetical protein N2W54_005410 [Lotmaria passim]
MMQRNASRLFLGGFGSGFSKGFFGGSNAGGGAGNSGSGQGFSLFGGKGGSSSGGNFGNMGGGGSPFGGPLGGFMDKALEWCSESHARDIAREMGVDLRNIKFEKTPEGGMNVMVDAPNATPLQIEQLGKRVQEECPVARFRKTQVNSPQQAMKWVQLPPNYDR